MIQHLYHWAKVKVEVELGFRINIFLGKTIKIFPRILSGILAKSQFINPPKYSPKLFHLSDLERKVFWDGKFNVTKSWFQRNETSQTSKSLLFEYLREISPSGSSTENLFNADFYDLNYPLKTLKIHLNLSMNITAVCPSLLAPLVPLTEMEIIERREHKFNCSETFRVPVYLCNWGRIDKYET